MPCRASLPACLTAGDSWSWQTTLNGYTPGSGWTLTYIFRRDNDKPFTVASEDVTGDTFNLAALPADTAPLPAGRYRYSARVTKGDLSYTVLGGWLDVQPDLSNASADPRSQNVIDLANIEETIRAISASPNSSYTTSSGTFTKQNLPSLTAWRDRLKDAVAREQGRGGAVNIRTVFGPRRCFIDSLRRH